MSDVQRDSVIPAEPADLDVLSRVIAEAFHDLAPSRWLIADPEARREIFPSYFRIYVEHALTSGVVHTTADRGAVALWFHLGENTGGWPADYNARLADVTGPWNDRFLAFDAALDRHHPTGIAHEHLAILAVRPDKQGEGLGTTLLGTHHAGLDDAAMAAYLEASDLRTRRLYLAHGYVDHGLPIHLADGGLMYPMWRASHGRFAADR